ncbi:MAG: cation:proton antiporter regulatory subunit [Chloroflexota bacterium]
MRLDDERTAVTIEEADLPGIGKRHDFQTQKGRRVGVVLHRGGRRDLLVYDARDPDSCSETVVLTIEEADALAELLGAPRIIERLAQLHEQVAGLVSEQLTLAAASPYAGRTLGDTEARSRTGASIVAVLRSGTVIPSPTPDFRFEAGDSIVVVGTPAGVEAVAQLLSG